MRLKIFWMIQKINSKVIQINQHVEGAKNQNLLINCINKLILNKKVFKTIEEEIDFLFLLKSNIIKMAI